MSTSLFEAPPPDLRKERRNRSILIAVLILLALAALVRMVLTCSCCAVVSVNSLVNPSTRRCTKSCGVGGAPPGRCANASDIVNAEISKI